MGGLSIKKTWDSISGGGGNVISEHPQFQILGAMGGSPSEPSPIAIPALPPVPTYFDPVIAAAGDKERKKLMSAYSYAATRVAGRLNLAPAVTTRTIGGM